MDVFTNACEACGELPLVDPKWGRDIHSLYLIIVIITK